MAVTTLSSIPLAFDYDVVAARRRARQVASLLHFDEQDQTRIATVASELARNALRFGSGGRVEFAVADESLIVTVWDRGPGTTTLQEVSSARRLMDDLEIRGTTIVAQKRLPVNAPALTQGALASIAAELSKQRAESPLEEIQQQIGRAH